MMQLVRRVADNWSDTIERSYLRAGRKKNIGYIGWVGKGNLGDDALYIALKQKWPDTNMPLFAYANREHRLARYGLSGASFFSGAVLGGGTLISPGYVALVRAALDQGLPVFTLGSGVGSPGYKFPAEVEFGEWKTLLPRCQRVGVRGPISQRKLLREGITNSEVIGDFALSLTLPHLSPIAEPGAFLVNLTLPDDDVYGKGEYANLTALEEILRTLTGRGWRPIPIAMAEKDIVPTQALIDAASSQPAVTELVTTIDRFFELARPCTLTIAMRLHATILSACVGVPALMLGYRDKCLDYMESVDLSEWHIDLNDASPAEIQEKAFLLSEAAPTLRPIVLERAQRWQKVQEQYLSDIRRSLNPP